MRSKFWIFAISTVSTLGLVLFMNYMSYHSAMEQFTSKQQLLESELQTQIQEQQEQWELLEEDSYAGDENTEVSNTEESLTVDTIYQVENYDVVKDQTTTDYETIPSKFIGFTREQTDSYFKKYMENLPVEEYLNGLQSIGVSSFSQDRLVIHKVYDSSKIENRFYLIAVEGEVVVYYSDQKTVYEYTGILTDTLTKEEQLALKNGVPVKDEEALYQLLENYSS